MSTATLEGTPLQSTNAARHARAALVKQPQSALILEDIEVAAPVGDEVRVRMVATGICHTDVVCRDGFPVPMPIVLGHEGAGVVEAIGSNVSRLAVGDHVLLSFNSCGACANCKSHEPAYCHQFLGLNFGGVRSEAEGVSALSQNGVPVNGAFFGQSSFATYAIAREINAVKVDKSLPLATLAPLGCGVQTGAGAVMNSLKVRAGRSIAIFGCGAVGLSAVMAAKVIGASPIVVVEPHPARRSLALELGATHAIDPKAGDVVEALRAASGGGLDYALDTSGLPAVMKSAVDVMLPNGMLGLIGIPPPDTAMPMSIMDLYMRGLGVKCIVEGDADPQTFIPQLVALYQAGKLPLDRLIKEFSFDQINEAFVSATDGSVVKPVLIF